jgi:hypothetical protein
MNENPKKHPLWLHFDDYASHNGISLENVEDWMPWWQCFLAGVIAQEENRDYRE